MFIFIVCQILFIWSQTSFAPRPKTGGHFLAGPHLYENQATAKENITEHVQNFEILGYNTSEMEELREELKTKKIDKILLTIFAFERNFTLILTEGNDIVSPVHHVNIIGADQNTVTGLPRVYSGKVEGDPQSKVNGVIADGIFTGFFTTDNTLYHIKKIDKSLKNKYPSHHSMIFKDSDVIKSF